MLSIRKATAHDAPLILDFIRRLAELDVISNEGIDRSHHPEFSRIETMTAYENYEYNMDLVEKFFRHVAISVFEKYVFNVRGHQIDFGPPWRRISMLEALFQQTGVDFREIRSLEGANGACFRWASMSRNPAFMRQ